VVIWLSSKVIGHINEVALHRSGLVLEWVTVLWYLTKPSRPTEPGTIVTASIREETVSFCITVGILT